MRRSQSHLQHHLVFFLAPLPSNEQDLALILEPKPNEGTKAVRVPGSLPKIRSIFSLLKKSNVATISKQFWSKRQKLKIHISRVFLLNFLLNTRALSQN